MFNFAIDSNHVHGDDDEDFVISSGATTLPEYILLRSTICLFTLRVFGGGSFAEPPLTNSILADTHGQQPFKKNLLWSTDTELPAAWRPLSSSLRVLQCFRVVLSSCDLRFFGDACLETASGTCSMSFSPYPFPPTEAETKALAKLAEATPAEQRTVYDVIHEIVEFCASLDVQGFLFTQDPIQISHLTRPNIASTALTGTTSLVRIEPNKLPQRSLSDHVIGSVMLVPAFTIKDLSLGFGVHQHFYSPAAAWNMRGGISFTSEYRYVRDDKNGVLVTVLEAPDADLIRITHVRLLTTTAAVRTVASFHRKRFLSVVANGTFDVTNLTATLFQLQSGTEYRQCPFCAASSGSCRCRLPFVRPKHPFDRETIMQNMSLHIGTFVGTSILSFLSRGHCTQSAAMGCTQAVQGTADQELLLRLRDWAVRRHSGNEDPLHSLMSSKALQASGVVSSEARRGAYPRGQSNQSRSFVDEFFQAFDANPRFPGDPRTRGEQQAPVLFGEDVGIVSASRESNARGRLQDAVLLGAPPEAYARAPGISEISGTATFSSRGSQSKGVIHRAELEDEAARQKKEEQRREQNRLSARRSNLKKKALNDALKQSLKDARERAEALRAREMRLRQENLQLRKQLEES